MHRVLGGLLAIAAFGPASAAFSQDEPSLAETLTWMDSTYNQHNAEGGSFGHGTLEFYISDKLVRRETESFSYDDCQITIHLDQDPNTTAYASMASSQVDTFNLRDIDPASIKMVRQSSAGYGLSCDLVPNLPCDIAEIDLETRDQAPLIDASLHTVFPKLRGKDHDSEYEHKTFITTFLVNDANYALRFVKALNHAIALCGGKRSPF